MDFKIARVARMNERTRVIPKVHPPMVDTPKIRIIYNVTNGQMYESDYVSMPRFRVIISLYNLTPF